jgi:hypothetical protein
MKQYCGVFTSGKQEARPIELRDHIAEDVQ